MARDKKGLGKGLAAYFGEIPDIDTLRRPVGYINKDVVGTHSHQNTSDVFRVPVDLIEPNPFQPRMSFDQQALEELAASVRTLGLIQPITVRKMSDNRYQIISGERRYKACRMVGMTMIPAYVRDANDQGMLEMAIVENIQRENLDPIETALSYQRLMDECSLTQENMADRVGKKRATIANALRLLSLPAKVQHDLKLGLLSAGHAKAILSVDNLEFQEKMCDMAIKEGLSVRQLEQLARDFNAGIKPAVQPEKAPQSALPDEYLRIAERIGRYFSNNVSIKRMASGKSVMTVKFDSDKEAQAFLSVLDEKNL